MSSQDNKINQHFTMIESENTRLYKTCFCRVDETVRKGKHLRFSDCDSVTYQSRQAKKRLLEIKVDRSADEEEMNEHDSSSIHATHLVTRKHYYFNDDDRICDKSSTPSTAEELLQHDFRPPFLICDVCNGQNKLQRSDLSFTENSQRCISNLFHPSVAKMSDSENCLLSNNMQRTKQHMLNSFGENLIQRNHFYFDVDGSIIDQSLSPCMAVELFEDDMKMTELYSRQPCQPIESIQRKHFWFDEDGQRFEKNVTQDNLRCTCGCIGMVHHRCCYLNVENCSSDTLSRSAKIPLKNEEVENMERSSILDLSCDGDSQVFDQFTSLKTREDRGSDVEHKYVTGLKIAKDTQLRNGEYSEFLNKRVSTQGYSDNFASDEESKIKDKWSSSESPLIPNHKYCFPDDFQQAPGNNTNSFPMKKFSDFLKITFGRNLDRHFIMKDEIVLEHEEKCPVASCQTYVELPFTHFTQCHRRLPKWKRNTYLAMLYLTMSQDRSFEIKQCLLCNVLQFDIGQHLCKVHNLLIKTEFYEELKKCCPLVCLSKTELLNQIILNAFKSYQRKKGFKKRLVCKQAIFLQELIPNLFENDISKNNIGGRLLVSNMYSLINVLCLQRGLLTKMLRQQLQILRMFLRFLHSNSDIFLPTDKDWWHEVLPSWNVLELTEDQLILVS